MVNEGFDYAVLESARKLSQSEYKLHPQLGYISLNQRLSNDEVLAVAYQYTYRGKVYQVGNLPTEVLKPLLSTIIQMRKTKI